MPRLTFAFTSDELDVCPAFPRGHTVRRPIIGVRLWNGSLVSPIFNGLVDTGADYSLLPSEYLQSLKIEKELLPTGTASGIATDPNVRFAPIQIEIAGLGRFPMYAGFSDNLNGQNFGMLGFVGFLEHFRFTCDHQASTFDLESYE